MLRRPSPFAWLLAVLLGGCATSGGGSLPEIGEALPGDVRDVLEGATTLELLVLHPFPDVEGGRPPSEEQSFHGYRILGRATLAAEAERHELLTLLYRGLLDSDGLRASCFRPRHGIRATLDDEQVDFVICFECLWMKVSGPADDGGEHVILTGEGVRAEMNAFCRRLGLEPFPS